MDLSGCTNYFPPLGRLVVLNSWFGYTSSNPFITHAFYIARDRSYWQRRGHAGGTQAPWQLVSTLTFLCNGNTAHTSAFIYLSRLQFADSCPSTLSTYRKRKERKRNPYTGGPPVRSPCCMGLTPQHKPRTPEGAGLTPGEGRLSPLPPYWPWQLKGSLQMKFLGLKLTATQAVTFSVDLITPGRMQTKSSSDKHSQISQLEATCPTFLRLCE